MTDRMDVSNQDTLADKRNYISFKEQLLMGCLSSCEFKESS